MTQDSVEYVCELARKLREKEQGGGNGNHSHTTHDSDIPGETEWELVQAARQRRQRTE